MSGWDAEEAPGRRWRHQTKLQANDPLYMLEHELLCDVTFTVGQRGGDKQVGGKLYNIIDIFQIILPVLLMVQVGTPPVYKLKY